MKKIPVSDVRQAAFSTLRVAGTPTLLLVDRAGRVTRTWVGKLRPDAENDVFAAAIALAAN
jgi:hypothetical protein